jgi:hypothetical protein
MGRCAPPMDVGKGFLLCWQIFSVMRGTAIGDVRGALGGQM